MGDRERPRRVRPGPATPRDLGRVPQRPDELTPRGLASSVSMLIARTSVPTGMAITSLEIWAMRCQRSQRAHPSRRRSRPHRPFQSRHPRSHDRRLRHPHSRPVPEPRSRPPWPIEQSPEAPAAASDRPPDVAVPPPRDASVKIVIPTAFPEQDLVPSPGGWDPPPGLRPGWDWVPPGGARPTPQAMP